MNVQGLRYLWGSAGLTRDLTFGRPLVLHVANDDAGEPVTVGTRVAAGAQTVVGTLLPGEHVSLPVHEIAGVYAECSIGSIVHCSIDS